MSTSSIFMRTLPYVLMRLVAYAIFGLLALLVTGFMASLGYLATRLFKEAGGAVFVILIIAIGILWGLKRLAERYVLYSIKAGHVAVITELVQKGTLPAGVNQVSYGKDKVLKHFAATSVLFGVDALVTGSVRQILRWLTRLGSFLAVIPGAKLLLSFVYRVLSLAGNYIDEAVLSYILIHEEQNVWRAAADGVVLYAQSWKKLLWRAVGVVLLVMVGWLAVFLISLLPLLGVASVVARESGQRFLFGFLRLAGRLAYRQRGALGFGGPICDRGHDCGVQRGRARTNALVRSLRHLGRSFAEVPRTGATGQTGPGARRRPRLMGKELAQGERRFRSWRGESAYALLPAKRAGVHTTTVGTSWPARNFSLHHAYCGL